MDKLEFRLKNITFPAGRPEKCVEIFINNKNFRKVVENYEDEVTGKAGHKYTEIRVNELYYNLTKKDQTNDRAYIFGCSCGETGCWPFETHIKVENNVVIWSDFLNDQLADNDKNMSWAGLGSYKFSLKDYQKEIDKIGKWSQTAEE